MSKIAILAGVNKYSSRWQPLSCSIHDVEELAAVLEMPEYGFTVRRLRDEEVTKTAIVREVVEATSGGADTVLFYFSGHGAATDLGTYLVTYDNQDFDDGIELSKLVELLNRGSRAGQSLAILDCCHSGAAATEFQQKYRLEPLASQNVQNALRPSIQSVAVMAACMSEQLAWEEANTGHGIFTHYLLEALLGDAVDHEGNLTASTLYEFISRGMATHGAYGDERQKPVFAGLLAGRLILGSGLPPVLPPPLPEDEFLRIEENAAQFLDQYNQFKASFDNESWRSEGHESCSRRLEGIDKWFMSHIDHMRARPRFKQLLGTLARYRTELGYVEVGTVVAEGVLEERVGEGGFGTVWRVRDQESGDRVALKIYHPHEMGDNEKARRFENGYDAMKLLRHPHVVKVRRYSRCPTAFVMDYIDGPNLRSLGPHTFLDSHKLIHLLIEIAETISHAHQNNVIHRDIKPENIVCRLKNDSSVEPYLTDFDLAWFSTKTQRATKSALGVVNYAAPEQFYAFDPRVALTKTPALDVFSFGQLLYFCITGRDPNPVNMDINGNALQAAALQIGYDNGSTIELCEFYRHATNWDSKKRIQEFSEVLRRLRAIELSLRHTSDDKRLDKDEFTAELIAHLTGEPVVPGSRTSFVSTAGTWSVSLSWGEKRKGRAYKPLLNIHFMPQGRIGLENVSNDQMRKTLNRRLDDALKSYADLAIRKAGRRGTYEVFVEVFPCNLSVKGIKSAADIISQSLTVLSR